MDSVGPRPSLSLTTCALEATGWKCLIFKAVSRLEVLGINVLSFASIDDSLFGGGGGVPVV